MFFFVCSVLLLNFAVVLLGVVFGCVLSLVMLFADCWLACFAAVVYRRVLLYCDCCCWCVVCRLSSLLLGVICCMRFGVCRRLSLLSCVVGVVGVVCLWCCVMLCAVGVGCCCWLSRVM